MVKIDLEPSISLELSTMPSYGLFAKLLKTERCGLV